MFHVEHNKGQFSFLLALTKQLHAAMLLLDDADASSELEGRLYDELADALDDLADDLGSLIGGSDAHDVHDARGPAEGSSDDQSEPPSVARTMADVLPRTAAPVRRPILARTGIGEAQRGAATALVRCAGVPLRNEVGAILGQAEAAVSRSRTKRATTKPPAKKGGGRRGKK